MRWNPEEMSVYRFYRWGSIAPARTQGWHTLGRRSRTPHSAPHYLVRSGTIHRGTAVGRGGKRNGILGLDVSVGFTFMNALHDYYWSVEETTCSFFFFFLADISQLRCSYYTRLILSHKQRSKLINYSQSQLYQAACLLTNKACSWLGVISEDLIKGV